MFQIRQELPSDIGAVNALLDAGFGADRRSRTVYRLRRGPAAEGLSFVAADPVSDEPLATIRFWEVALGERASAVLLGPLAVHNELRGQGLGRALVSHGLTMARDQGWDACVVSGEPSYYAPYGFIDGSAHGLMMPGPLKAGWLQLKPFADGVIEGLPKGPVRIAPVPVSRRRALRPVVSASDLPEPIYGAAADGGLGARFG